MLLFPVFLFFFLKTKHNLNKFFFVIFPYNLYCLREFSQWTTITSIRNAWWVEDESGCFAYAAFSVDILDYIKFWHVLKDRKCVLTHALCLHIHHLRETEQYLYLLSEQCTGTADSCYCHFLLLCYWWRVSWLLLPLSDYTHSDSKERHFSIM